MKIAYICRNLHRDRGGIEVYTAQIAEAMARHDHQVHIITQDKGDFCRKPLHPNVKVHPIRLADTPFPGFWKLEEFFPLDDQRFAKAAARELGKISSTDRLDVVEASDYFRQGFAYATNRDAAFVLRLHGWLFNRPATEEAMVQPLSPKETRMKQMIQVCIDHADTITAVSSDFAEAAKKVWSMAKPVQIVPNAVDVALFRPEHKITREKAVIFASRLTEAKGICTLAEAMPQIIADCPDVHFYIAGKNMPVKDGSTTAKDYILHRVRPSYVTFLGEISTEELITYYQRSLIAVFPSLYESFGMAALEAMACGCATVVTDVGGFKDFVTHAQNGLRIPVQAALPLARAVIRFLNDEGFCLQCRDQGTATVRSRFSISHLTTATEDVYQKARLRFRT